MPARRRKSLFSYRYLILTLVNMEKRTDNFSTNNENFLHDFESITSNTLIFYFKVD